MKRQNSQSPDQRENSTNDPVNQQKSSDHNGGGQQSNGTPHGGMVSSQSNAEYDTWRSQPQQIYNPNSMPDYIPSYYPSMSPPYLTNVPDSGWSAGRQDIAYLSNPYANPGLSSPNSPYMDGSLGIFGAGHPGHHVSYGFGGQTGFNYFTTGNGDYSAWGPSFVSPGNGVSKNGKSGSTMGQNASAGSVGVPSGLDYYGREYNNGTGSVGGIMADYSQFNPQAQTHHHQPAGYEGFKQLEAKMAGIALHPPIGGDYITHHSGYGNAGGFTGHGGQSGGGGNAPVKKSWAAIASQPAKPNAPGGPKKSPKIPIGNVARPGETPPSGGANSWTPASAKSGGTGANGGRSNWSASHGGGQSGGRSGGPNRSSGGYSTTGLNSGESDDLESSGQELNGSSPPVPTGPAHPVLDKLRSQNEYNPTDFNLNTKGARYFVIKSYSEDDIHRSIKYGIWCSTEHGNKRLDNAFKEREGKGPVYLIFSVNGSGHFCGVAQMNSNVDYHKSSGVWTQDKWKGQFLVRWIYVKDVPNAQLRHIRLENNENKPVTNSRDTQEVPPEKGRQVLLIIHKFAHSTSIFDDFIHYEKRQEEEDTRKGSEADEDELPPVEVDSSGLKRPSATKAVSDAQSPTTVEPAGHRSGGAN